MRNMKLYLSPSKIMPLSEHKYAQCYVRKYDNGVIDFISYTTLVLRCMPVERFSELHKNADEYALVSFQPDGKGDYVIVCTGTYSQTTRKQITWFLREYFSPNTTYQQVKRALEFEYTALLTYIK